MTPLNRRFRSIALICDRDSSPALNVSIFNDITKFNNLNDVRVVPAALRYKSYNYALGTPAPGTFIHNNGYIKLFPYIDSKNRRRLAGEQGGRDASILDTPGSPAMEGQHTGSEAMGLDGGGRHHLDTSSLHAT